MTNVNIDSGVTGAKRATWRKTNPRSLLQRIGAHASCSNGGATIPTRHIARRFSKDID